MRRVLIVVAMLSLLTATGLFAFEQGTINVGGGLSFTSDKAHSDDDAVTTLSFSPQAGYFIIDNLSGDLLIQFDSVSNGYEETNFMFGLGARYFFNQFYGGAGFLMKSVKWDDFKFSANYIDIKAGYMFPLVENVFIDLGVNYMMGLGEYGGDGSGDNEESKLRVAAGLQVFFPMGR